MSNEVKLTFAGDSSQLERAFKKVGEASQKFGQDVEGSSDSILDSFRNIGGKAAGGFSLSFTDRIGPLMAKAPVSGPLLAAFAAAAPTVAAALTSGILLGLGGGVLAAGIKAAAGDPKVAAAFGGLRERAKAAFADFGTPFKAPLIRAAKTFGDLVERIAPAFKRMGTAMAPLIDKLAPALAKLVEGALPGIEKAVVASIPLFEKLAEHAPAIGEAISKFFDEIAKGAPSAVKFIEILLKAAAFVIPKLGAALRFLTEYFLLVWNSWKAIFKAIEYAWDRVRVGAAIAVKWVQDKFTTAVNFLKGLPKKAGQAFSGMFDGIKSAFKSALNWIIDKWNNFSIPKVKTPFGDFGGFNTPDIKRFHRGGMVPGSAGSEMLAVLQAGETVNSAGAGASSVIEIRSGGSKLDDLLVEVLSRAIRVRGGNVQLVLGTGRG